MRFSLPKLSPPLEWFEVSWRVSPRLAITSALVGLTALFIWQLLLFPDRLSFGESTGLIFQQTRQLTFLGLGIPQTIEGWPFWFSQINLSVLTNSILPRLGPALIALAGLGLMYALLKGWFNRLYAFVGLALLSTHTAFVHSALQLSNTSLVLVFLSLILLALTNLHRAQAKGLALLAAAVSCGMYLGPYGWTVIAGAIVISSYLFPLRFKSGLKIKVWLASLGLLLVLLIPFIILVMRGTEIINLPEVTPSSIVNNLTHFGRFLSLGSAENPLVWSADWPLFGVASLALMALGFIVSISRRQAWRYALISSLWLVGLINIAIFGLTGPTLMTWLVPATAFIVAGVRYLSQLWMEVFPKNSAAQSMAAIALAVLIISTISFNLTRSFIFWPRLPEVEQTYSFPLSVSKE